MNFDDALKHYAPRAWFRFKSVKYKYFKRGEPEIHLIRHLIEPGTTALDIGCSIGIYAAEMARSASRVIAFEANPAVARFARAVAPRKVEVINVALSSTPGRATLKIPRNPMGDTIDELATIEPGNPLHAADAANAEIEMKRLDDVPIANCSFIKIDVEGHEEKVIRGGLETLRREKPVMVIEIEKRHTGKPVRETHRLIESLGYEGFFFQDGRRRPLSEYEERMQDPGYPGYVNDFLFLPAGAAARSAGPSAAGSAGPAR